MSTSTRDAAADQQHLLMLLAEDMMTRDREHHDEMRELIATLTPPAGLPVNVDVPHVQQAGAGVGSSLTATMGNWQNMESASSYRFQWKRGAANVGTNSASYAVTAPDIGTTMTCVVTATNALGSTAAPPSNSVTVV